VSNRTRLLAYCEEHDIKVYDYSIRGHSVEISIWTPKGKMLKHLSQHSAKVWFYVGGDGWTKDDAWGELLDDLKAGLTDCTVPNCDTCNDPEPLAPSDY
jgi:hypothetical protein